MDKSLAEEIYRAFVLLGADFSLLGSIGSIGDTLTEEEAAIEVGGWNKGTLQEIKGRIEHFETCFLRHENIPSEGQQT